MNRNADYYYKNRDRIHAKQYAERETKEGRALYIFYNLRTKSRRFNIENNLELSDIKIPDICPILNVPLDMRAGKGLNRYSPSVDRIDNNKGYVKGNIQVVSNLANRMKSNATRDELLKFASWITNEISGDN